MESLQDIKSEQAKMPPCTVQMDGEKEIRLDKIVHAPTEMSVRKTFLQASTIPASSVKSGSASTISVQQKTDFRTQLKEFQRKLASTPVELPQK